MIHKPAAKQNTPLTGSQTHVGERDTLADTPELRFLRDEIEALLGSATVRRVAHAPNITYAEDHAAIAPEDLGKEWLERATESESSSASSSAVSTLESTSLEEFANLEEIADEEEDTEVVSRSFYERETLPSVDVQMQRDAARIAGK